MSKSEINEVIEQTKELTDKVLKMAESIRNLKLDIKNTDNLINKFDSKLITWEEFMDLYYKVDKKEKPKDESAPGVLTDKEFSQLMDMVGL